MSPSLGPVNGHRHESGQELSIWDQTSSRCYFQMVLCFPVEDRFRCSARRHLIASLLRLAKQRPDFAGKLKVNDAGLIHLEVNSSNEIPFTTEDLDSEFPRSYDELRAAGFPPGDFVHRRFTLNGGLVTLSDRVSVFHVGAFFIRGGLLLRVGFHHGYIDGVSASNLLQCFAAQTRHEIINTLPTNTRLHLNETKSEILVLRQEHSPHDLMGMCREYTALSDKSGPNAFHLMRGLTDAAKIAKTGKVFVFYGKEIEKLRQLVNTFSPAKTGEPSPYVCLAAFTWCHVVKARLAAEEPVTGARLSSRDTATMFNPVNWKRRAFADATQDYFGNTTAVLATDLVVSDLQRACIDYRAFARVARCVETSIASIDEAWVARRLAMFGAVTDPRDIGLASDPRSPHEIGFNTWRNFGADLEWMIPGVGGCTSGTRAVKAEAICRAQGEWNMGGSLILPSQEGSSEYKILVTLPVVSMDVLCKDAEWRRFVRKVVD